MVSTRVAIRVSTRVAISIRNPGTILTTRFRPGLRPGLGSGLGSGLRSQPWIATLKPPGFRFLKKIATLAVFYGFGLDRNLLKVFPDGGRMVNYINFVVLELVWWEYIQVSMLLVLINVDFSVKWLKKGKTFNLYDIWIATKQLLNGSYVVFYIDFVIN